MGLKDGRTATCVAFGCFDEKWDVDFLFANGCAFAESAAFTDVGAVIACDEDGGVFIQACGFKGFEEAAKAVVHPGDFGCITGFDAGFGLVGQVGIAAGLRSSLEGARIEPTVIAGRFVVFEHEFGGYVPGFVGVEAVDPEEEIFPVFIVAKKLGGGVEESGAVPVV